MREEQQAQLKNWLQGLKKQLAARIQYIDTQGLNEPLGGSISELSAYDNHPADIGSEVFERSKDFALRENAMLTLTAVEHALAKIERGKYGVCEACGREIQRERLEAVPYAALCRQCKEKEESKPDQNIRPVEEEVLGKPFARTDPDDSEAVGYDGEDAWREVARYSETEDEWARGGSYYGYATFSPNDEQEAEEDVDNIPYEIGKDGVIYRDFTGVDDEGAPAGRTEAEGER